MKKPLIALVACCLCQCAQTTVKTYDPITGKLVGETTTNNIDAGAFTAGANAATAIATARVHADK